MGLFYKENGTSTGLGNFWDKNKNWMSVISPALGAGANMFQGIGNANRLTENYFSELENYSNTLQQRADSAYAQAGDRPTYEIPESVKQSLAVMKELSNQKAPATADMPTLTEMPGMSKYMDKLQTDMAGKVGAIKELGGGSGASIGALSDLGLDSNRLMEDLAVKNAQFSANQAEKKAMYDTNTTWRNAQFEQGNKLNYAIALNQYGNYEDRAFQYNQADPYAINMNRGDMFQFARDQNYYDTLANRAGYANEKVQSSIDNAMQFGNMFMKLAPML